MTDRSQQTTGTTGKSQMDQDHEARVKMIIKDNEKGLVLLEYLRKKDKDEIRKLKKKYSEV